MAKSFVGEPIGGRILINPGTGPVEGATEAAARKNMTQLLIDSDIPTATIRRKRANDGRGRFGFVVRLDGRAVEVEMPGLPLEEVRYLGRPQDPWEFPRLYVDKSSWLWCFATSALTRHLKPSPEAEEGE